jgi:hypothetical protein
MMIMNRISCLLSTGFGGWPEHEIVAGRCSESTTAP